MNWKAFTFVTLVILTIVVVAYFINLYSIPSRLYMYSQTSPSIRYNEEVTLSNVTDYDERRAIENYVRGNAAIGVYIDVSDEMSGIRDWAESTFKMYRGTRLVEYNPDQALFGVRVSESEYYMVHLIQRKAYYPSDVEYKYNAIFNLLTIAFWAVFLYSITRWHPKHEQTESKKEDSNGLEEEFEWKNTL